MHEVAPSTPVAPAIGKPVVHCENEAVVGCTGELAWFNPAHTQALA